MKWSQELARQEQMILRLHSELTIAVRQIAIAVRRIGQLEQAMLELAQAVGGAASPPEESSGLGDTAVSPAPPASPDNAASSVQLKAAAKAARTASSAEGKVS